MQISLAKHKTMEVAKQACHFGPKIVATMIQTIKHKYLF